MRIIPAIDIIDGKCVRLTQGDYSRKQVYNEDPLAVAQEFERAGLKYLHLVDLDGAKAGKVINWAVVEKITGGTGLTVDFGGGIKTDKEIERLFDAGIAQVNLGSIAVKNKTLVMEWAAKFGHSKIILSADVKNELISINGWMENSNLGVLDFISGYVDNGITYVTCTDISTDGTLQGPNVNLYKKIMASSPTVRLVASGGVGSVEHLRELESSGVDGVIVGKAIYEGKVSTEQLLSF